MAAEVNPSEGEVRSADGTRLHCAAWEVAAPRLALVVVHGHGEHGGRYSRVALELAARGISCYAVDLRGMGRSDGRRGHILSWRQWLDDLDALWALAGERAPGVERVPLGHSFGGVLVASAVLAGRLHPERFVLSNPAFVTSGHVPGWKLAMGRLTSRVLPATTLSTELDPSLISRDPVEVAAYAEDPLVHDRISAREYTEWVRASAETRARAEELRTPFLVILGTGDRIIDPDATREFVRRAGAAAQLREYEGRYHEPFNDLGRELVIRDLGDWLLPQSDLHRQA